MLKKILLLSLFLSLNSLFSQHTVTGHMKPVQKYNWLILYKLDGVNQKFVGNADIKDGKFIIKIPKGSEAGMYRLLYDNDKNLFLDFIYNNEDVSVEFHPEYPSQLVKYDKSKENKVFQSYVDQVSILQNKLDSLQVIYFQTKNISKEKLIIKLYDKELAQLRKTQQIFENKSKNTIANHFVRVNKRFYSNTPIKNTNDYLKTIKQHYFDFVDFEDPILLKSSVLIDRIMDFVLYLSTSKNTKTLAKLRKEAIATVLSKINKPELKKDVIESLLYTFAKQENLEIVDYIFANHFKKLPVALQDFDFKEMIKDMLKTSVGIKVPNIEWKEKGKNKSLYNLKLKNKKYYLVVFWSSSCPHCLKELPRLQKYLGDKPEIQVVAIALETKKSKIGWIDEKYYYEEFIHVLALSSSEDSNFKSKYVKDYGVDATPNFFLLDENKILIAKPYDVKELIEIYPKLKEKEVKK